MSNNVSSDSYNAKEISLKEYIAGSLLANSILWIVIAFIPSIWRGDLTIRIALVLYIISMIGGTIAGYLMARRTGQNYLRAGIPTGIFSYILHAIFLTISGIRGDLLIDAPPLIGFVLGGAIGTKYWEIRKTTN